MALFGRTAWFCVLHEVWMRHVDEREATGGTVVRPCSPSCSAGRSQRDADAIYPCCYDVPTAQSPWRARLPRPSSSGSRCAWMFAKALVMGQCHTDGDHDAHRLSPHLGLPGGRFRRHVPRRRWSPAGHHQGPAPDLGCLQGARKPICLDQAQLGRTLTHEAT